LTSMDWAAFLAICFFAGMVGVSWKLNRFYERKGDIFAIPWSISRERTPKFFRVTMILNWFVFGFLVLLSLAFSALLISTWVGII
jgi:hypothetical protein